MSDRVKTCVVCGEDCSGRPRTKDARGRYFCTPCYERKAQEKRQSSAEAKAVHRPPPTPQPRPMPMSAAPAAHRAFDDPFAIDPSVLAREAAAAAAVNAPVCPDCGAAMLAGAVICMNCGHDVSAGERR